MTDTKCNHEAGAREYTLPAANGEYMRKLCCSRCHWPMKVVGCHVEPKLASEMDEIEYLLTYGTTAYRQDMEIARLQRKNDALMQTLEEVRLILKQTHFKNIYSLRK